MSLFTSRNKSIYFHHIPKTGGSTIYKGLLAAGIKQTVQSRDKKTKVNEWHLNLQELERVYPEYKNYVQFTIIRHPWKRLISEYIYQTKDTLFKKNLNSWLSKKFNKYTKNLHYNDNHFLPQYYFINDNVKVFSNDNLIECEIFLCNYFNMQIEFQKKNVSSSYILPDINILNDKNRKRFYEIYEQDIKLYKMYKKGT